LKASGSWKRAALTAAALFLVLAGPYPRSIPLVGNARASSADSLVLQTPNASARSVYDSFTRRFVVWVTWNDFPDSCGAFINRPDTTGWVGSVPPSAMSAPLVRGPYKGDTDRTLVFTVRTGGTVGTDQVVISCDVRREENITTRITLPATYAPNTWVNLALRDQVTNTPVDYGLQVRFGPGLAETGRSFTVGLEDFEGFHVWRGTRADGSDLEVIGELSKEEAFKGRATGGSFPDSVYFYDLVPTLRSNQPWFSPFGAIDCLGNRIDFPLESDQLFWWDCHAVNGFTYYYMVTTFDRDYTPSSGQQGLNKFDNCFIQQGEPIDCVDALREVKVEVAPQNDLYDVYAVPNPYRSGTSRLTATNYHNYPDDFIRFVNVPTDCTLKVYTVAGDLVWEYAHNAGSGNIEWDTRNDAGQDVASGVYVFRIEASNGDFVYGRLTIIR